MTSDRWEQVNKLYYAALDVEEKERPSFLEEACGRDTELRVEVESLLSMQAQMDGFLGKPAMEEVAKAMKHDPASLLGRQLGSRARESARDRRAGGPLATTRSSESSSPAGPHQAPWWMFAVAASYIALLALIPYLVIWGPADLDGLSASFENGAMFVRVVEPETPPARAGLQVGDRVLAIDGRSLRSTHDWAAVPANMEVGRLQRWEVLRGDARLEVEITPARGTWQHRLAWGYISYTLLALSGFAVGLFIGFRRPRDPVARMGAWFITTTSVAFGLPSGWAACWRQVPAALAASFWIPELSRFVLEGIFLSLFMIFPRRLFRARWPWSVIWAPVLATLPWRVSEFYSIIYNPGEASAMPGWVNQAIFLRTMVYLVAVMVVLAVSYRRLIDRNEKRRVRVVMAGTATSLAAAIGWAWYFHVLGYGLTTSHLRLWMIMLVHPLTLACPLAFAYAILRHRLFDIQVIVRLGLQYALSRAVVLGVVPALGVILILDLGLNSREPLVDILRERGWIYAGLASLALVAYRRRTEWLEALDRRFFRERYNAQRLLREVVEEIRGMRDFTQVSPRVVAQISTALHPEFISLMVCQPDQGRYQASVSVPSEHRLPPLAADSKLAGLMGLLGKPLEILLGDSSWLDQRLPPEEIDWVHQARVDLLVPIAAMPGRAAALLALGVKRSEEPYTREDQELLEAIASSLALVLEEPTPAGESLIASFEECPECGLCFDRGSEKCSVEGVLLTSISLPRTLEGRYRLERRLGRGGMGTVYAARDSTLERRVAVKVIRDDLLDSPQTVQRFRRESRAAAAFTHPNVVTVYDYGVAGTRAFLVMELLEGGTLWDELHRRQRLAPCRTCEIFRGVCAAVDAAHRRPLIHRDLKPANIFLARSGEGSAEIVKVLDFGLAKFLDHAVSMQATTETASGAIMGTLAYMSPEQLLGVKPEVSWDLWALAVIAYEMLTGTLPFGSPPAPDWRRAVLACSFTSPADEVPGSPPQWQSFFEHCFAKDTRKRPQTALEFFHLLEQTLT